ncbi:MAG: DUF3325 domain-containing protein [Arenicella sp.]|nr:DUF3325 domain-containing protein [Arenicella sp.]
MSLVYLLLAIGLTLAGCVSLALSQNRNWQNITETNLSSSTQRLIRTTGWVLLCIAFMICSARDGVSFAIILWLLLIGISSFIVAMILSFKPSLMSLVTRTFVNTK